MTGDSGSRRWAAIGTAAVAGLVAFAGHALAHGGSLRGSTGQLSVPPWLFLLTGGGVVSASFLLASFVTDRAFVRAVHGWRTLVDATPFDRAAGAVRALSVLVLIAVVVLGVVGPDAPRRNVAVLVVWVGWWAGFTASVYLVGNGWPALNPWRALADWLPSFDRSYPERAGAWPSVVGLLGLVWLEVVSPLADDPDLLVTVVVGYTLVTLAGAVAYGSDRWFSTVDPVSRVFRYYGRVAPIRRTDEGFEFRIPGAALTRTRLVDGSDEVAFVVAILWVTTYDGLVATGPWAAASTAVVEAGVPALAVYLGAYLVGFGLFLGAYRFAARQSRRTASTYLTPAILARRFAPTLLPIAAGYHLAHFLGYFLSLSPALVGVLANPLRSPANPVVVVLPGWFGGLEMAFILLGHLLAIWVAHATAYDVFPGRIQAVRSQYSFVAVMVLFTMTSLWILSEPYVTPPYL